MPIETVKAESLLEGLIWLVIFVFWVAAQVFGAKDKKKRPGSTRPGSRPQQPRPKPRTTEETLREFLEGLNEPAQDQRTPPPLPAEREEPREATERWTPPPPKPAPAPARAPAPQRTYSSFTERESMIEQRAEKFQTLVKRISKITGEDKMTHRPGEAGRRGRVSVMNISKVNTMDMRSMRLPIARVPVPSLVNAPPSPIKPDFYGPNALERAIMSRIILGPPRAMAPENYEQNTGAM